MGSELIAERQAGADPLPGEGRRGARITHHSVVAEDRRRAAFAALGSLVLTISQGDMHVKVRSMIAVGAMAGGLLFGSAFAAQAAGPNSGSCTNTRNNGPTLTPVATPAGVPRVYGQQTGTTAGDAGIDGGAGYLEAGGSTSGGYVSGAQNGPASAGPASVPASGLNGTIGIDSSPTACVGVAGKGGVGVP